MIVRPDNIPCRTVFTCRECGRIVVETIQPRLAAEKFCRRCRRMYAFAKVLFAIIVSFLLMMVASECYHNEEFVPFEEVKKVIDLNEIARAALKTATEREKKGQLRSDTMSILKHCAGEVCEATEAYSRRTCEMEEV